MKKFLKDLFLLISMIITFSGILYMLAYSFDAQMEYQELKEQEYLNYIEECKK